MPTGPGPRQRRATKIANRSHVTPFDRLAQWNAEIMRLGSQGAVPSIVGNDLQFKKLSASDISGAMQNPATEDLDMNGFGNRLEVDSNVAPYISITGINEAKLTVKSTNTALIEMEGPVSTVLRGKSKLKLETDNNGSSNNIEISPYGTLALQSLGVNGGGNGTIFIGDSSLVDATANVEIETFTNIKMDANGDIEIDAAGRLDLSGSQIYIDSDGAGVNIAAVNEITMDAAKVDVEATTKLDLSGTNMSINSSNNLEVKAGATLDLSSDNTKLNGTTDLEIIGSKINIGTSSSAVDISGQITLNNVSDLKATNITATGAIFATPASRTGNTITTQGIITTGAITDGTATMSSGTITGLIDVSTNSITLKNTEFTTTSQTRDLSNAPYVWGVNYLEQISNVVPPDPYLVGSYKQIKSALFYWEGSPSLSTTFSYTPPNNVPPNPGTGLPVITPPCLGGGELLPLGTPKIWDLPIGCVDVSNHTFTIPQVVERTMMTVDLSVDIKYNSTGAARVNTIFFWLGKNAGGKTAISGSGTGPMAYRMATHMPAYFGTDAMEPIFCHNASITLLGGDAILPYHPDNPRFQFNTGDTFYLTAQCVGSPSFPEYVENLRVKVTWEAVN